MTCKRELLVHNTVYYQAHFLPMPSPFKITILTKTVFLLSYFLTVCSLGNGQEVIYPNNFINYPHTPTEHERFINAFELANNAGFLFPLIENIPYDQSNGYYYSSAKLIKTDSDGDVTNTFLVSADTFQKRTYSGGFARVVKDQILFYASIDSAVQNQTSINKGLIIYHLKESNLSYISSDTLVGLLPTNAALNNWFLLEKGDNSAYCVLDYLTASGNSNSKIFKLVTNSTGTIIDAESKAANLIASADTTKMDFILSVFWNEGKDSLQFFASYQKPSNMQMWAISTVDTFLNSYQSIDVTGISQNYLYEQNKHLEGSPFVRGRKIGNNKVVIGPYLYETESPKEKIGFLKFDLSNNVYEKGLVIPDSAGLSLPWKTAVIFDNEIKKGDNLFCMGNDFNSYNNFYFEAIENHIYVGKTDTAMNQWQWYKYIGKPGCFLVPYKLLATSDGGCLITAGIYDFVNNTNLQHDLYIIKLDGNGFITHVTNLTNSDSRHLSVYPVPAQNEIFLSYNGDEPYDLVIHDIAGKMAWQKAGLTKTSNRISISNLTPGNYFYQAHFKNGKIESGKIIKQ